MLRMFKYITLIKSENKSRFIKWQLFGIKASKIRGTHLLIERWLELVINVLILVMLYKTVHLLQMNFFCEILISFVNHHFLCKYIISWNLYIDEFNSYVCYL